MQRSGNTSNQWVRSLCWETAQRQQACQDAGDQRRGGLEDQTFIGERRLVELSPACHLAQNLLVKGPRGLSELELTPSLPHLSPPNTCPLSSHLSSQLPSRLPPSRLHFVVSDSSNTSQFGPPHLDPPPPHPLFLHPPYFPLHLLPPRHHRPAFP